MTCLIRLHMTTLLQVDHAPSGPAKHTHPVVFGRKVAGCPRCLELANGAAPIKGWGQRQREAEAEQMEAIRKHDCKASHCGPVCTFGDW